jgi:hypothetical protein
MRPGEQQLRGGERTDARFVEQLWCELAGERCDLGLEVAFLDC